MKTGTNARWLILVSLVLCLSNPALADTLYDKRFKAWVQQAEQGDPDAQYNLGNAYLQGTEVKIDLDKALEWFSKASQQNHAKAQYKLGYLYYLGKGVRRDYSKAFTWFRKSAQQDYSPAQYYLGNLYAEGNGTDKDYEKALYWFTQAAADNHAPAKEQISEIKEAMAREAASAAKTAKSNPPTDRRAAAPAKQSQVRASAPKQVRKVEPAKPNDQPESESKAGESVAAKPQTFETKKLLRNGRWVNAGGVPARHMPSELTICDETPGYLIACSTERLTRSNLFATITYLVSSEFGNFKPNGEFMGSYRTRVLTVKPDDPNVENASEDDIPSIGWKAKTSIRCKFEDENTISCVNDNFQRETFTRE